MRPTETPWVPFRLTRVTLRLKLRLTLRPILRLTQRNFEYYCWNLLRFIRTHWESACGEISGVFSQNSGAFFNDASGNTARGLFYRLFHRVSHFAVMAAGHVGPAKAGTHFGKLRRQQNSCSYSSSRLLYFLLSSRLSHYWDNEAAALKGSWESSDWEDFVKKKK